MVTTNFFDPAKNFAVVEVSTGYDASATSVALVSGDGAKLPAPATEGAFNLVWWNSSDYTDPSEDPDIEIVRVTARSTDTLTIVRPAAGNDYNDEGSENTASAKNIAGKTYKMMLAWTRSQRDRVEQVARAADTSTPPYNRAYFERQTSPRTYTGIQNQGNQYGNAFVKSPNSGKYIHIKYTNNAPSYLKASEIDPTTGTETHLTISGSVTTNESSSYWTVVYHSSDGKLYLYSRNSSRNIVYPLTLSGTTLTVGTSVDPSTYVATSGNASGSTVFASDGTYLYFLITYTGELVRYATSGGTWNTSLTDSTATSASAYNPAYTLFSYSDGYIYKFSFFTVSAGNNFERYSVSGNSWSTISFPTTATTSTITSNNYNNTMVIDSGDHSRILLTMYSTKSSISMYEYNGDTSSWTGEYGSTQSRSVTNLALSNENTYRCNVTPMSISGEIAFACVKYSGSYYEHYSDVSDGFFGKFLPIMTSKTSGVLEGVNFPYYNSYSLDYNQQGDFNIWMSVDGGAKFKLTDTFNTNKVQVPAAQMHMGIEWTSSVKMYCFTISEENVSFYWLDNS